MRNVQCVTIVFNCITGSCDVLEVIRNSVNALFTPSP